MTLTLHTDTLAIGVLVGFTLAILAILIVLSLFGLAGPILRACKRPSTPSSQETHTATTRRARRASDQQGVLLCTRIVALFCSKSTPRTPPCTCNTADSTEHLPCKHPSNYHDKQPSWTCSMGIDSTLDARRKQWSANSCHGQQPHPEEP